MSVDPSHDRQRLLERLLLERDIEDFLHREAELLDDRRFEDWLELLTDDVRYFIPMRRNVAHFDLGRENTREGRDMNWFDEGKQTLSQRVRQLRTGKHWAEEPLSRVTHMIANVRVTAVTADPGAGNRDRDRTEAGTGDGAEASVRCRFLIHRNRMHSETDLFVGRRHDVLRRVAGDWKIARREILLDQSVLLAKNLTFFF